MMTGCWQTIFAGLVALFATTRAFNIDAARPLARGGARDSYFGFSIAAHFANELPVLLVGAPRAESGQPGTRQAGAVFACALDFSSNASEDCAQLQVEYATDAEFRRPPQRLNSKQLHSEGKNNQLLGFVVASSGAKRGGHAMACAPLLRYGANAYTDGACYLLSSELNHTGVISTCNSLPKKDRHNDYGACQQGFSALIDDNIILTGLPGARKWTGGVFGRYEFLANGFPDTVEHWTMEVSKEQSGIINVLTSHDYLGYSVAHGRFGFWYEGASAEDASFTIVSGATRFQQTGGVVFLPFRRHASADEQRLLGLDDNFTIAGAAQLGAGFGASLLVLDLNADGYDDLIVGAPYEFQREEDVERGGAVYVYFSSGVRHARGENDFVFHAPVVLRAGGAHSQFGYALTALGNVDNDPAGCQDFAIGAPQEDNGRGAVFIFHGAPRDAFQTKPAQTLRAKDLPLPADAQKSPSIKIVKPRKTARRFGAALAGGIDLDANGYGDLLVGAYVSDKVFLFRTRPVVDVTLGHVFPQKYIKIDDRRLATCPTNARNCFTVTTTLLISDRNNTGAALASLERDGAGEPFVCRLELIPYAKGIAPRGIFIDRNRTATTWPCGGGDATRRPQKRVHQLYVPQSNQDWTNALRFNFTVEMRERPRTATDTASPPLPVINARQSRHVFDAAFDKKCGDDNDCHTDLVLTAILLNITRRDDGAYVTKVTERDAIVVRFVVENRGERAFYARLYVHYNADELDEPQKLTNGGSSSGASAVDVERKDSGLTVLTLGNPLEEGRKVSVDLSFNLVRGSAERVSASLAFAAHVNSTSIESQPEDNEWNAEMKLIKEADLQLGGASRPAIVRFSNGQPTAVDEVDIGPEVVHVYTLTNHGPFYARNVTVTINWPLRLNSERSADDWALYTLEEPVVRHHNGKTHRCASPPVGAVNPLHVYNDETLRLTYQRPRVKRMAEPVEPSPDAAAEPLGLWALVKAYWRAAIDGVNGDASAQAAKSIFGGRFLKPTDVQERSGSRVRIGDVNCLDATAICVRLTCHFDYVGTGDSASIEIRARLWNYTFANDYKSIEYFALTSDAFVEVDPTQGILEDIENNFARVSTHAYPDRPAQDDRLAWWMLALAALVGLLLLGVLVLICRRCGFFRRRSDDLRMMHTAMYRRENDEFFGN